uniref:Exocyst complex component Sec3 C-terminal domain-containing protein n=1 Tax=Timspurckia oligopyrenoides TaxID=708627 RepID=A0A7S0ZK76_9RHOD|mmetsp:Transcript_852/g.1601  ORF Transcript_852/g.1601 Transcript_852/m.1601 type:complete len:722 (+) Transcript_852:51-2216(+)
MDAKSLSILEDDDLLWKSLGLKEDSGGLHDEEVQVFELIELEKAAKTKEFQELLSANISEVELSQLVVELEAKLLQVESNSIEHFVKEGASLSRLNRDLELCDTGLHKLELELTQFADDLDGISSDMQRLEQQTISSAQRAKTRSVTEAHLSTFLDQIILSPSLIKEIVEGDVGTKNYQENLRILAKKAAFLSLEDTQKAAAYAEIKPKFDLLQHKAVQRVRDFMLTKIELLRKPNTNIQIIKGSVLLRYQPLMEFLQDHAREQYLEVRNDYVETVSILYTELFRKYIFGLVQLKEEVGKDGDWIIESSNSSVTSWLGSFTQSASSSQLTHQSTFGLGKRIETLKKPLGPAVVLAVATSRSQKLLYEEIHRSISKMLLDTCTSESYFCVHLFGEIPGRLFADELRTTEESVVECLKSHVSTCYDLVGLLILLKLNEMMRAEMEKRNIKDLSDFFLNSEIIIKPRVKELFDLNLKSLQNADARSLFRSEADVAPRIVTRRYAEFNATMTTILSFGNMADDTFLRESIRRFRMEYQSLMQRISALFSRSKSRYVFLINNYDFVLSLLSDSDSKVEKDNEELDRDESSIRNEEASILEDAVAGHIAAYVEQELTEHFPDFLSFIRSFQRSKSALNVEVSESKLRLILRDFMANYRVGIDHIRNNILREFPNFENGVQILKRCLAQLLNYHKRFEAILDSVNPKLKAEMVTTSALIVEIKKASEF